MCVKGLVHIMKYLAVERKRYNRQRSNSVDMPHDQLRYDVDICLTVNNCRPSDSRGD